MSIYQEALGIKDTIVTHRRHLHQIPELGLDLPQTAAYVEEQLHKMGYETKRIGDCGIVALAGKKEGKCFLIRADMDALPVVEAASYKKDVVIGDSAGFTMLDCHGTMMPK